MNVELITGPGSHAHSLIRVLCQNTDTFSVYQQWPKFEKKNWNNKGSIDTSGSKLYDSLSKVIWRLWNNVPGLNRSPVHLDLLFPLFDMLVAKKMEHPDILWAWSQMSSYAIRRYKKSGKGKVILEYPMVHPIFWNKTILEEKRKYVPENPHYYSLYSPKMTSRMLEEIVEADIVNVLSTFASSTFIDKGISKDKLRMTKLGVDTQFFYPSRTEKHPKEKIIFLYVGRLELWKGVQYLMEAFHNVSTKQIELWLVGNVLPEVKDVVSKYEHDQRIKFIGVATPEQLRDLYNQADCMLFPTLQDSFGMVILEALACGCPVVATTNSAGPDIITEKKDGLVIPPRNIKALEEAITWVLDNRSLHHEFRSNARKKAVELFSLDIYSESICSILNECKK